MKRRLVGVAATAGVVVGVLWVTREQLWPLLEQARKLSRRTALEASGRWDGFWYHFTGRRPNPWVDDDVLADRVRSTLGPLEHRLDVPRVDVRVHDHIVSLHGHVPSSADADAIEAAVLRISGVYGMQSFLDVGFGRGDTRPSEDRIHQPPSTARQRLLGAARRAGETENDAPTAVRAVLGSFIDRIPVDERDQLIGHLPRDARELTEPPRRVCLHGRVRSEAELLENIALLGLTGRNAAHVTESVLAELRALVPEEAGDVAAVLPAELRELWNTAVPA